MGGFARRMSYWNAFAHRYPRLHALRLDTGAIFSVGAVESSAVNRWLLEGTRRSNLDAVNLNAWDLPVWQELCSLAEAGLVARDLLDLPLVSANVTPKLDHFPGVRRSIVKEITVDEKSGRKVRIGITGLLHDPEERISRADFIVEDPTNAARAIVAELSSKTDFRVVMTDMDLGRGLSLAIAVRGINLLVVSHNYVALQEAQQIGDTLIVVVVNEGRMLNEVRLALPVGSDSVQAEARFVPLDRTIPDEPGMAELIRRAQTEADNARRGISPAR